MNLLKMSVNKQQKTKQKIISPFASSLSKEKKATNFNLNLDKIKEEVEAAKERIKTINADSPRDHLKVSLNSKILITEPSKGISNIGKYMNNLKLSQYNKKMTQ